MAFQSLCRAAPWVVAPGVCALAADHPSALTLGCSLASCDGWWSVCLSSSPQPLPSRSLARGLSGIRIGNWGEDELGRDLGIPCAFPHLSTDLVPIVLLVSPSRSRLSHPCVSLPRLFVLYIIMFFPRLNINISEEGPDARELIRLLKCMQQLRSRRTDTLEHSGAIPAHPSSSSQSRYLPRSEQPGHTSGSQNMNHHMAVEAVGALVCGGTGDIQLCEAPQSTWL